MAQYFERDIKRVKFDLSKIKVGESIFSTLGEGEYTLCVRISKNKDEDNWEVYSYKDNFISSYKDNDPHFDISPNNEIFDKKKTEWVVKYWRETSGFIHQVQHFTNKLMNKFLY